MLAQVCAERIQEVLTTAVFTATDVLFFYLVFEATLIGLDVEFLQWLTVEPGELENVGAQLAKQVSTRYVSATAGRFNLCLHGVLPGYGDLYHYMTAVIGALPGEGEAIPALRASKVIR